MARCLSLQLTSQELELVAEAVDRSLNVPKAREEPKRDQAVRALVGAQVQKDKKFPQNVVKRRALVIQTEKRKEKKKSNWPVDTDGRSRIKKRTAELRAKGIQSPYGRVSASGEEYIPSVRERTALAKVKAQVADLVGTKPDNLSLPLATVSMIASGGPDRRLHTKEGTAITVALHDQTPPLEIMIRGGPPAAPDPLDAGEAIAYDRRVPHREPLGDFRRTLCFTLKRG